MRGSGSLTFVPGDVVELAAGDMIPGDVRIVHAKDLFVTQGSLTGESFPCREAGGFSRGCRGRTPLQLSASIAFLGTSVESGSASAVVIATGRRDLPRRHGHVSLGQQPIEDGVRSRHLALHVAPAPFHVRDGPGGVCHQRPHEGHAGRQAFFFALAVAVGLTPEMLPMIVTVCLSKGAVAMSRKKVIVKRLDAIQNLGAMDVLCTDKTGTLTHGPGDPRALLRRQPWRESDTRCSRSRTRTVTSRPASRTCSIVWCLRTRRSHTRARIPEVGEDRRDPI